MQVFIYFAMASIDATISNHFEMFFRNVSDQAFYEINCGNCFDHIFIIFMPIIVKSNIVAIIAINSGSGDNRATKVAANIFNHRIRIAFVWFCIDVKTFFVILIASGFYSFERRTVLCSISFNRAVRKALRR